MSSRNRNLVATVFVWRNFYEMRGPGFRVPCGCFPAGYRDAEGGRDASRPEAGTFWAVVRISRIFGRGEDEKGFRIKEPPAKEPVSDFGGG